MQGSDFPITRRQRFAVAIAAVLIVPTRFMALSLTPWDWDEVLFCLAVGDYNVAAHFPHPPGFPLYIFLGRIARLFADTDFHALQAVNVIAGCLAFPVMFWLARSFRMDFNASFGAGLLFAFMPNIWFFGGTAFSDVPAAVLYCAAIAAYMSAGTETRRHLLASLLFGAAILIRPQNAVVTVFPWTLAAVRLIRAKNIRGFIAASLLLAGVVLVGYGGAALATGVDEYIAATRAHSEYVRRADGIAAAIRPPLWEVFLTQLDPYDAGKASLLINALAVAAIAFGRRRPTLEILLTWAPFFFFAMIAVNPLGASRFALNYVAGFVLLATEGAAALGRLVATIQPRAGLPVRWAFLGAVIVRMATWTPEAFEVPRTTPSPPVAAATWIDRNVPTSSLVFVDESIWPWAMYFAPRHKQVRPGDITKLVMHPGVGSGWFIANGVTSAQGAIEFIRPRTRVWNIVTRRCFESFVMPATSIAKFARGWYGEEGSADYAWRWGSDHTWTYLGPIAGNAELHMKFAIPLDALEQPVTVSFSLNGKQFATVPIKALENEVRFIVPARGDIPNLLRIDVSDKFVPAERGENDHRDLAFMLRSWNWRPAPSS
jgi:hypothetical protein